jgi:hypothetical protein
MTQLEIAQKIEIEKLKKENELMRKLSTVDGFFIYYFSQCPVHKTNIEAFNTVNQKYFDLFGEFRYSDIHSFKKMIRYHTKKTQKQ